MDRDFLLFLTVDASWSYAPFSNILLFVIHSIYALDLAALLVPFFMRSTWIQSNRSYKAGGDTRAKPDLLWTIVSKHESDDLCTHTTNEVWPVSESDLSKRLLQWTVASQSTLLCHHLLAKCIVYYFLCWELQVVFSLCVSDMDLTPGIKGFRLSNPPGLECASLKGALNVGTAVFHLIM